MCVCWCVCMVKTLKSLWQSNAKSKSEIEIRKRNFQVDFIRWQTRTSKILVLKGAYGCGVCEWRMWRMWRVWRMWGGVAIQSRLCIKC